MSKDVLLSKLYVSLLKFWFTYLKNDIFAIVDMKQGSSSPWLNRIGLYSQKIRRMGGDLNKIY